MGIICLEDIRPGMILGKDLKDRNGLVLLREGHEITEKHLKILKMWGIIEADIQGVTREEVISKTASQVDPDQLREVENQAREWFHHTDLRHPFMKELFHLLTLRKALQKLGEDHGS